MVDILADVLRNSKLDAASVEEERKILLTELEESDGLYRDVCFDYLHSAAYQVGLHEDKLIHIKKVLRF